MYPLKLLFAVVMGVLLTGCVTPPPYQPPRQASPSDSFALGSSALLLHTDHINAHLNTDKNILYTQMFGGGGAGVGLMFGALGVAANMAMISSRTSADAEALFGKLDIQPVQALQKAAEQKNIQLGSVGTASDLRLTPYVYIVKTTEYSLSISAAAIYEAGSGAPAKYAVQLPGSYSIAQLASLDADGMADLQAKVDRGFAQLLGFVAEEGNTGFAEQSTRFRSSFMSPRHEFELQGTLVGQEDDLTWIRTVGGVYGLQTDAVNFISAF